MPCQHSPGRRASQQQGTGSCHIDGGSAATAGLTFPCATLMSSAVTNARYPAMIAMPDIRPQAAVVVGQGQREHGQACIPRRHQDGLPGAGPSPVRLAGTSNPAMTLIALLFRAVLSTAAPRPRLAR